MRGCTSLNAKNARKGKKRADSLCGQVDSQLDICRTILSSSRVSLIGVHLCHGLSYPISSQGKSYFDKHYSKEHPLIPHGLSVVCTAPADFLFTTCADPKRHLEASQLLGSDLPNTASPDTIANVLADQLRSFMSDFGCPNGLKQMGFDRSNVNKLAEAALNSFRSNPISPREIDFDSVSDIYEKSINVY
ncbi:unnamed protein product [Meloidogyne enterolobii]|uniref:Uncharacterized protein n=1 Tax=Meloidogyne enterolobii TaxID=390850 RepID=A0ACB1API5_MELEN